MRFKNLRLSAISLVVAGLVIASLALAELSKAQPVFNPGAGGVDPQAGTWKPWLLSSASQLRPAAPPDKATTDGEVKQLKEMAGQRDAAALDLIAYWDTGSPSYRWNNIALDEALKHGSSGPLGTRALALMHVAIYDALVATWDAKYTYNRQRPSQIDPGLTTVIATPQSPSYPSEYAATAGAASAVLAYLFPDDAPAIMHSAQDAGKSRVLAGVEFPSDVDAGMTLGQQVGALAVAYGKADNSDAKWTGSVPTDKGKWNGTNPSFPMLGSWKPWILKSGDQFRPGPPPAYDSDQEKADLAEVLNYKRTPVTIAQSMFWEGAAGGFRNFWYWADVTDRKIFEYRLDSDPPRAARVYALIFTAYNDSFIACWDAKYTYWAIRPFMLDPNIKPVFTTPNHPSYPSAHSCLSNTAATVLGYLFPREADALNALADQASESRVAAGIHFRTDIVVGKALGLKVGQAAVDRAKVDGSQ